MIGDLVEAINQVGLHQSPYPSLADAFYLAFYPLLLLALLRVPVAATTRAKLIRTILDGATIVVGGGAVVWYFVLGPTAVDGGMSPIAMGVSMAVADGGMRFTSRASWLPYLSVAIALGVLIGVERSEPFFPDVSLVLIVIVLAALVSVRQYAAQREPHRPGGVAGERTPQG